MGGFGGFGMIFGWLISLAVALALAALAVLAIIALVKYIHGSNKAKFADPAAAANSAQALLDERYAKGEIDDEEYAKKKEALRKP
jgi:putative membrane protein